MASFGLAWHFATAISSMVLFNGWHGIADFSGVLAFYYGFNSFGCSIGCDVSHSYVSA